MNLPRYILTYPGEKANTHQPAFNPTHIEYKPGCLGVWWVKEKF